MPVIVEIKAEPQEVFAGEEIGLTVIITKSSDPTSNSKSNMKDGLPKEIDLVFETARKDELFCRIELRRYEDKFGEYKGVRPTKGIPAGIYRVSQLYDIDTGEGWTGNSSNAPSCIGNTILIIKESQFQSIISKSHAPQPTDDQGLWAAIRNRTRAIGFDPYANFINHVFCVGEEWPPYPPSREGDEETIININDIREEINTIKKEFRINAADSYSVLRLATQFFLFQESGLVIKDGSDKLFREDQERHRLEDSSATFTTVSAKLERYLGGSQGELPYLKRILNVFLGHDERKRRERLAYCNGILEHRFGNPSMLELIWSYWHEEAMLVQSMNAIALRFQNRRGLGKRDPLAHLEIDPLHGLNNLLWAQIQNEHNRLTLARRSYEYDHLYGISLYGKAVPTLRSADTRSKFLEGFHTVLNRAADFYRQNANTQVNADAFPLLNAIKRVHLCLAEGAHNQFGDLPWTARVEMLIEQWILARPEMGEFLHQRAMVPYREPWMGRVDAMKTLQGWTDTPVTNFNELAVFGEQLILSLRYGDWVDVNDENQARNWALYWKPEIQSYINSYQVATGVDLSAKLQNGKQVDSTPPAKHLLRKLRQQQRRALAA